MNELKKNLRSVGKGAFVEYFDCFQAYASGKKMKEEDIRKLREKSNENGVLIRLGASKKIFDAELQCKALRIVSQSSPGHLTKNGRNGHEVIAMAKSLMEKHCRP